jgi:hypothetical protein
MNLPSHAEVEGRDREIAVRTGTNLVSDEKKEMVRKI